MPSAQSHQSSHCFGVVKVTGVMIVRSRRLLWAVLFLPRSQKEIRGLRDSVALIFVTFLSQRHTFDLQILESPKKAATADPLPLPLSLSACVIFVENRGGLLGSFA